MKYLFSSVLREALSNLLLGILVVAIWVLLYISGCSLTSNLPIGSTSSMLYIIVLWIATPILALYTFWQRFVKHRSGIVKHYHYGLLFCTSFFFWSLLSIIIGLGPCYRYHIAGTNCLGEALLLIITLPLFMFEAGYRLTSLSFPLLVLLALTIVFSLGLIFGYLISVITRSINDSAEL